DRSAHARLRVLYRDHPRSRPAQMAHRRGADEGDLLGIHAGKGAVVWEWGEDGNEDSVTIIPSIIVFYGSVGVLPATPLRAPFVSGRSMLRSYESADQVHYPPMALTPYQIVAPLIALTAIFYAWNLVMRQKKTVWEACFWTVFWGAIAAIAM